MERLWRVQGRSYDFINGDVNIPYLPRNILNISFQVIVCQEICQQYALTSNHNLRLSKFWHPKHRSRKMFLQNLWQAGQNLNKKFHTMLKVKQYVDWISTDPKNSAKLFWSVFSSIPTRITPNADIFHAVRPSICAYVVCKHVQTDTLKAQVPPKLFSSNYIINVLHITSPAFLDIWSPFPLRNHE